MDAGCLVEFDHPHILLKNKTGFLTGMVNRMGPNMAERLKYVAKQVY